MIPLRRLAHAGIVLTTLALPASAQTVGGGNDVIVTTLGTYSTLSACQAAPAPQGDPLTTPGVGGSTYCVRTGSTYTHYSVTVGAVVRIDIDFYEPIPVEPDLN